MAIVDPTSLTIQELESDVRGIVNLASHQPIRLFFEQGHGILMLPEDQLDQTDEILNWVRVFLYAERASRKEQAARVGGDFPDATWLQHLDDEDLSTFIDELCESLLEAIAMRDLGSLRNLVSEWETTANALSDPIQRATLLEAFDPNS